MENHQFRYPILVSIFTAALGLISFTLCIAAEFKKSKKKDLRFDGKFCYLPGSKAFELGIAALICFITAQVIGSFLICFSRDHQNNFKSKKNLAINGFVSALSWISFGMAIIIIGAGSSMSKSQPLGEGWVDGECYIVKDGLFTVSAFLILLSLSSTFYLVILKFKKKNQVKQDGNQCSSTNGIDTR